MDERMMDPHGQCTEGVLPVLKASGQHCGDLVKGVGSQQIEVSLAGLALEIEV